MKDLTTSVVALLVSEACNIGMTPVINPNLETAHQLPAGARRPVLPAGRHPRHGERRADRGPGPGYGGLGVLAVPEWSFSLHVPSRHASDVPKRSSDAGTAAKGALLGAA